MLGLGNNHIFVIKEYLLHVRTWKQSYICYKVFLLLACTQTASYSFDFLDLDLSLDDQERGR
jgi:hypothetical protein